MGEETSDLIVSHIRSILSSTAREAQTAPLFVGLQGPQGIGKTTITRNLLSSLQDLRLAVLSIDDFYLSYSGLEDLAKRHVNNGLLKGRGQPGTHDIALLQSVLDQLSRINDNPDSIVEIPIFDKSLHEGKGDRLPKGHIVKGPLDIVILEGWCVGFYNLPHDDLESRFRSINSGHPSSDNLDAENKTLERDIVGAHRLEDIQEVNAYLRSYGLMYPNFTTFIQLSPPPEKPYTPIYEWRLEQEHWMKSQNGGRGMTDAQVKLFIDRYIPGYIFFSHTVRERDDTPWTGRGLRISLNEERNVVGNDRF